MGKVTYLPGVKEEVNVITLEKGKVLINGKECESMDINTFFDSFEISPEDEEYFIRGLFQIIKEECFSNWRLLKIFKEIFK